MGGHGARKSLGCIQDVQLVCATLSIVATKKEDLVSFQSTYFRRIINQVKAESPQKQKRVESGYIEFIWILVKLRDIEWWSSHDT